jgi:acetyl-CoA carboxylase biotin carboxylase subunit
MTSKRIRRPTISVAAKPPFKKILIANRGEIAVRIMRACAEMGIWPVAVYSDADRSALHVRYAREAVNIGPPPATESYLRIDRIIEAAKQTGAEAIHPGYGFLAENAEFSQAVTDAGLVFIGPPASAMEALGDKVKARQLMLDADVPVVPGTPPLGDDPAEAAAQANKIGYPVLLKAAAGGGGKGMRIVRNDEEMASLLAQAKGEAASAFGSDVVFLEKYIVRPRHIEVQIMADSHGNVVHLGERECSIQRRHQKLIEESPSPIIDAKERERIGELAIRACKAAGYVNAGTVEFLRGDDGSFYFMEVNARLQVEHPVTEEVTGIDMVRAMIEIAAGKKLAFTQDDIDMRGHAIECRIIAEDPSRNFMPAPGTIRGLRPPSGPGIRYDDGTYPGYTIPVFYDPMFAKLVAWGQDRNEAIARMSRALEELRLDGVTTSVGFHRKVMSDPDFIAGNLSTAFIEEHPELLAPEADEWLNEIAVVAAAIAHFRKVEADSARASDATGGKSQSAWKWQGRQGWGR